MKLNDLTIDLSTATELPKLQITKPGRFHVLTIGRDFKLYLSEDQFNELIYQAKKLEEVNT